MTFFHTFKKETFQVLAYLHNSTGLTNLHISLSVSSSLLLKCELCPDKNITFVVTTLHSTQFHIFSL